MPRNAKNASRVARQRQHDARVNSWMAQFDVNGSGRLERPELAALLTHIHPQKEPPQERILDMLITQATEVRTYSMHLPGDPSGAVPFDKIMKVVNAFTAYTLASAAFDSIGAKGVLSLAELPSLNQQGQPQRRRVRDERERSRHAARLCSWAHGDGHRRRAERRRLRVPRGRAPRRRPLEV